MLILKAAIIIVGVISGIYLLYLGIPRCKNEGFKFNIADFFKRTPLGPATGGYCIVSAFLCLACSFIFYYIAFVHPSPYLVK